MTSGRKNGENTEPRDDKGRFQRGNSGKPKGTRHRTTTAVQELLDGEAETLTRKAIELAIEGDTTALKICIDRIAPVPKDRAVNFDLPAMASAKDAAQAAGSVLQAVANGKVTPHEAASIMGLVESYRKTLETSELEARIEQLEAGK